MVGKILPEILGFELASFSDKKSKFVWERQGALFLDKKSGYSVTVTLNGFKEEYTGCPKIGTRICNKFR